MRIGKRNLSTFLKRISSLENYKAITKFRKVHINPLKSFYQEIFSTGTYPQKIKFKTPTGQHEIEIYSPADFSTFNLGNVSISFIVVSVSITPKTLSAAAAP